MHGGHHFFDSSGNDVQVWGSSTSLFGIVADGTATQLLSSATLNATWDCADSQGSAYCVNSSRNALIQTNGATMTWFASPLGTMVAITPERLLIAGVAAAPNSIYYSAANSFTNFTVGNNVADSSIEQIASPGSRLTHIEYACGRWLWWKDQSFGYVLGTDQTNLSIRTVSSVIGTKDNSSAIDPDGNVYFRAQDGHIYKYDCTNLTKLTQNISPSIQTSGSRTSNLYIQTSQSDWQSGTIVPTGWLSTTISAGDVMPSSATIADTLATDFTQGTLTNVSTSGDAIRISTTNQNFSGFDSRGYSYEAGSAAFWTADTGAQQGYTSGPASSYINCTSINAKDGSSYLAYYSSNTAYNVTIAIIDASDSSTIASQTFAYAANQCTWTQRTLTLGSSFARRAAKIKVTTSDGSKTAITSTFWLSGQNMTFYTSSDEWLGGATPQGFNIDFFENGGMVSTGTYISRTLDTNVTGNYVSISSNVTINEFSPYLELQDSADGSAFQKLITTMDTSIIGRRYIRYISSFTMTGTLDGYSTINDVTVVARSSGTYYSPVVNRPSLTSWDTFNATYVNNNGTHSFYMRASTSPFTVLNATPTWVAQTPGSVISASTGTYFQFRDDFGVIGSTHNPTLSDVTVNWFEGTATDKAYATYYDNAIWWGLAYGSGQTTNNYVFRYDLIINGWTLYNIGVGGFLLQNNALYFGSPTTNSIYRFGNSTSDNGSSINAYWKSKDFPGSDPWLENSYTQMDVFAQRDPNQTLTVDYGLNASTTTTSFNVSLSSTTNDTIRFKKLLPAGKIGGLFNAKFSDTSATSSWELLGFRVKYETLPYRPTQ